MSISRKHRNIAIIACHCFSLTSFFIVNVEHEVVNLRSCLSQEVAYVKKFQIKEEVFYLYNVPGIKAAHRYLNYSCCINCCKFQVRRLSLTLSLVNNRFPFVAFLTIWIVIYLLLVLLIFHICNFNFL